MKVFNIYDKNLVRIGEISTFVSSVWNEGYNTVGKFQLEVQNRAGILNILQPGNYVGKIDKKTLMIIKSVQKFHNTIIVNGYPVVKVLEDRASTEVVSKENAEKALRRVFSKMTSWDRLELGELANIPDIFNRQYSDGNVLDYSMNICQEIDAGFTIEHDREQKKMFYKLYKPTDNRNLVFAAKFGNLTDSNVTISENDFKNVAVVSGSGEGEKRITITVGAVNTTGVNRREIYLDARHIQPEENEPPEKYKERLENYGLEVLAEHLPIQNVKISVNTDDFGTKFWLGDNITCILADFGLKLKVKIIAYTETIQRNGTTVEISVGTPVLIQGGKRQWQ